MLRRVLITTLISTSVFSAEVTFKGLVLGVGVIYDRVKLETQKNKADVQIVAPYLSISMPLGKV